MAATQLRYLDHLGQEQLDQDLNALGQRFGWSAGHFHVAYYIANAYASQRGRSAMRSALRSLLDRQHLEGASLQQFLDHVRPADENPERYKGCTMVRLEVERFCQYRSFVLDFPQHDEQPLLLIGGKNGYGKTNFFKAVQAALYGLENMEFGAKGELFNDGADGLTLKIKLTLQDGRGEPFRITRERHYRPNPGRPKLEQQTVTLEWLATGEKVTSSEVEAEIERFLPRTLADYFLFDAQSKVDHFLKHKRQNIEQGIERILGIEALKELLKELERLRKELRDQQKNLETSMGGKTTSDLDQEIEKAEQMLDQLRKEREKTELTRTALQQDLMRFKEELDQLSLVHDEGRHQQHEQCVKDLGDREAQLKSVQEAIDRKAQELLPLLLVADELRELQAAAQPVLPRQAEEGLLPEVIRTLYQRTIDGLESVFLPEERIRQCTDYIFQNYKALLSGPSAEVQEPRLEFTREQLRNLETLLDKQRESTEFAKALARRTELEAEIRQLEVLKNSLEPPKPEMSKRFQKASDKLEKLTEQRTKLDAELEKLAKQITEKEDELRSWRERAQRSGEWSEQQQELHGQIQRVENFRSFIEEAGQLFRQSKVGALEQEATAFYRRMTNKPDMPRDVKIDPDNFEPGLWEEGRDVVDTLSTGESRIFVMALIAGLSRISGKKLPMVIDTPFGGLDTEHREKVCSEFLPQVAHQVLVLSTDEELVDEYLELVRPHLAGTWRLARVASGTEETTVEVGYFD